MFIVPFHFPFHRSIPSFHSIVPFHHSIPYSSPAIRDAPIFCHISLIFCLLLKYAAHSHFDIQQRHKQFCTLQKRIGCFKHWMVTLVAEKLRRQCIWKIYVGIRANYISNLSPNHTLQLTTWTSVRESLQVHLKIMTKLGDSQMFSGYYICKIMVVIARSLIQACRCDSFLSGY